MAAHGSASDRIGGIDAGLLVAYADGTLAPEEARAIEHALRNNPEAQEAVLLMRNSAAAVRHAFDAPLGAPLPDGLRALTDQPAATRAPLLRWLLPLAASIAALAVGFGGGYLTGRPAETGAEIRLAAGPASSASHAFSAALLQALAGEESTVEYADEARGIRGAVTLLDTLETSFGTVCREFRHVANTAQPNATTELGLACRRADGGWEVSVLKPVSS